MAEIDSTRIMSLLEKEALSSRDVTYLQSMVERVKLRSMQQAMQTKLEIAGQVVEMAEIRRKYEKLWLRSTPTRLTPKSQLNGWMFRKRSRSVNTLYDGPSSNWNLRKPNSRGQKLKPRPG